MFEYVHIVYTTAIPKMGRLSAGIPRFCTQSAPKNRDVKVTCARVCRVCVCVCVCVCV
jgi:hypothetical protein